MTTRRFGAALAVRAAAAVIAMAGALGSWSVAAELDPSKPATWEAAVQRRKADLDAVARELMAIARDEKAQPDARRKAVFLLGESRTQAALEFLVENVTMFVPMETIFGDADAAKQWPCHYALDSTGWAGAEAVFNSLKKPKTARESLLLAEVLRRVLGPRFAKAAVDAALADTKDPTRTKNLTAIKTYLHGG